MPTDHGRPDYGTPCNDKFVERLIKTRGKDGKGPQALITNLFLAPHKRWLSYKSINCQDDKQCQLLRRGRGGWWGGGKERKR